jgi:hypothetical protein
MSTQLLLRRIEMEPYRKITLALVIAVAFLMTGSFLRSAASTVRIRPAQQVTAKSRGVDAKATIKIPSLVDEIQFASSGEAKVEALLPGSSAAQYDNTILSSQGLQSLSTGRGNDSVTITKIAESAHHVVCRSTGNNLNILMGAVTADRIVTEMSFDSNGGNITNLVKNVTFKNLRVNDVLMPNNPQANTVIEFDREISIFSTRIPVRAKVIIRPESVTTDGGNITKVRVGGIDVEVKSSASFQGFLSPPRHPSSNYGEMIRPYYQRAMNTGYKFLVSKRRSNADGEEIYRGVGKSFDLNGGLYSISHHSSSQDLIEYALMAGFVAVAAGN